MPHNHALHADAGLAARKGRAARAGSLAPRKARGSAPVSANVGPLIVQS